MSRSVTVAVAYIMSITNLSWKEALKVVRVGRSVANPNVGFQRQLEDFESSRLQEVSLRIPKVITRPKNPRDITKDCKRGLTIFTSRPENSQSI